MNIRYMSDLHLEGGLYLPIPMEGDKDATLILAGDIHVGDKAMPFLCLMCDQFKYVIYVFGNHEFYHSSIPEVRHWYAEQKKWNKIPDNLFILDNHTVILDEVRFIGSTLWTDMGHDPLAMMMASTYMNDFSVISKGIDNLKAFTPEDSMAQHEMALHFLENELKTEHENTVIVTHHLPHYASVAPRWRGNPANNAFFSDLNWIFEKYKPEYWIHGHTHDSVFEVVDETVLLCNPKGYGRENQHDFNPKAMFEI